MSNFEIIVPKSKVVTIKGKSYEIKPLKVKQLPAVAEALKPMNKIMEGKNLNALNILDLVAENSSQIVKAITVCTGIKKELIEDCFAEEIAELIIALFAVNSGFFLKMLPKKTQVNPTTEQKNP